MVDLLEFRAGHGATYRTIVKVKRSELEDAPVAALVAVTVTV
jgi:hypothetical protein